MRFRIPDSEVVNLIARWMPTQDHMTALAVFAHQQVKDRHETQGASGGTPWPQKVMKSLGYDDGRAILTGPSAKMLLSWFSYGEVNGSIGRAVTANDQSYSFVHELGTEGKGGKLPTIRPKTAKALFIPITDRAIAWYKAKSGSSVRLRRTATGWKTETAPATFGPEKKAPGVLSFGGLIKGRIKNGRLQKWDADQQGYVDGVPDFIFLQKSDIAPRPQYRISGEK